MALSDMRAKPDCHQLGALCLMHFTTHFTVSLMNVTAHKNREEMRQQKDCIVNFGETPKVSVTGKDTKLVTRGAYLGAGV